jgi:AGZA family xanthine/uracil permease-like MFS transporter
MGGRAAYTLATGLFIGIGGMLGIIAFLANALPKPALAPILVYIALDIVAQSYNATPRRHTMAVALAALPSIAALVVIFLSQVYNGALLGSAIDPAGTLAATGLTNPAFIQTCAVMVMLAHGFFLTAMLWGGSVAYLIDRRVLASAALLLVCAGLSFFGVIHSVTPSGGIYLPWSTGSALPYQWTAAYAALAVMLVLLARTRAYAESPDVTA